MHLVTVNDYLAKRDAENMGRIHRWLGLDVGLVIPGFRTAPAQKRQAYGCDITYGTNNEVGFDYLRDNMAGTLADKVQRGHSFAIVDEVDSILIDEARTPLIISGRLADAAKLYYRFASVVRSLRRDVDYEVEEDKRVVVPLEAGIEKVEQALGIDNLYDEVQQNLVHQLSVALKAKELYKRDKDYIVANGEVKIVDEFTGRILEGRRWSEGIHQAVEAKEGVKIKEENQTLATVTLQNYFRMYDKLAGMTGTAQTEAAELMNTYGLAVVPIPTNKPMIRVDQPDLIYKGEDGKFGAVVDDIAEKYDRGQPVLVGTISVEKSERLSRMLDKRGVPHEVLNAKQHTREAVGRGPGGAAASGHGGHQHGRPWCRHPARRQPRGHGPARGAEGRPCTRGAGRRVRAARGDGRRVRRCARGSARPATTSCSTAIGASARSTATRCASSAACTCWAPSDTRVAASTTSCAAVRAARATPARAASTSASTTS